MSAIEQGQNIDRRELTMLNFKNFRNPTFVIEPSTTVLAMIPSKDSSATVDVLQPLTKGCCISA